MNSAFLFRMFCPSDTEKNYYKIIWIMLFSTSPPPKKKKLFVLLFSYIPSSSRTEINNSISHNVYLPSVIPPRTRSLLLSLGIRNGIPNLTGATLGRTVQARVTGVQVHRAVEQHPPPTMERIIRPSQDQLIGALGLCCHSGEQGCTPIMSLGLSDEPSGLGLCRGLSPWPGSNTNRRPLQMHYNTIQGQLIQQQANIQN